MSKANSRSIATNRRSSASRRVDSGAGAAPALPFNITKARANWQAACETYDAVSQGYVALCSEMESAARATATEHSKRLAAVYEGEAKLAGAMDKQEEAASALLLRQRRSKRCHTSLLSSAVFGTRSTASTSPWTAVMWRTSPRASCSTCLRCCAAARLRNSPGQPSADAIARAKGAATDCIEVGGLSRGRGRVLLESAPPFLTLERLQERGDLDCANGRKCVRHGVGHDEPRALAHRSTGIDDVGHIPFAFGRFGANERF
jgi:hypothetical protein